MANNGEVLLHRITPRNLLSFGPETDPIDLKNLNVLIGPNGSGKSNLIESIILMRATASDMRAVIRKGGGVIDWIWKGAPDNPASIDLLFSNPYGYKLLRHFLSFREIKRAWLISVDRTAP